MKKTEIDINKSFVSLNFDTVEEMLTGDRQFYVTLNDVGDEPSDDLEVYLTADSLLNIIPDKFTATPGEPQLVTVRLADSEVLPEGNFNFKISVNNEYAEGKEVTANVLAKENSVLSDNSYKLKYFIQREKYTCNIYQLVPNSTVLTPLEINGRVDMSRQDKTDFTEPIIATSVKLRIEGSTDLTFEDLYSENEKTFKVEIVKDEIIRFQGFIIPDQMWEDWVRDKWELDITATCGLSSLKNIAFAQQNSTGDNIINFFGRMKAIDIITNCLQKTGLNLPIYANIQISYLGLNNIQNILNSIYLPAERYFQNEKEPMDCQDVLSSVLQIFGATVVQDKNRWYIYRSKDITNPNPLTSDTHTLPFGYFLAGSYLNDENHTFGNRIGSQINNATFFHCSENQKKTVKASVQAYQIKYSYGGAKNVLANGGLYWYGTNIDAVNGIDMPGWDVRTPPDGANKVLAGYYAGDNFGVRSVLYGSGADILLQLDQIIQVLQDDSLVLKVDFRNIGFNSTHLLFAFGIVDGNNLRHYYNIQSGQWNSAGLTNAVPNYYQPTQNSYKGRGEASVTVEATVPFDGHVFIIFYRNGGSSPDGQHAIARVSLTASENNIKSKDYIARKNNATSTNLKENVTVYNGDSESSLFVGTIYKSDSITPTSKWRRYYFNGSNIEYYNEEKELLEIIAEEGLSTAPRPMSEFEGDFYGYIDYVNFFTIDGFERPYEFNPSLKVKKQFQFLKWSYSFDSDITRMFAREIEGNNLDPNTYNVKIYENFGNESKVTIVS